MPDNNEIVVVELNQAARAALKERIATAMEKCGHKPYWPQIGIGFDLPAGWPIEGEITLAQLVVLAKKLNLRIRINYLIAELRKE